MAFQTSYGTDPSAGTPGMLADGSHPHSRDTGAAEAAIGVGLAVVRGTAGKQIKTVQAVAAAPTSILASGGASAAGPQTVQTTALNGAIGQGRIVPAQQVSLVLSSHANWDLTNAVITGEDADGNLFQETVSIPDGGNATVKTVRPFGRVISVYIPTQSGTGGTFTIGTSPDAAEFSRRDILGVSEWQGAHMPYETGTYANGEYAIGEDVPYFKNGRVWVKTEAVCVRDDSAYVRIVASGDDKPGQWSNARSANFALVRGVKFHTAAGSGSIAQLQLT